MRKVLDKNGIQIGLFDRDLIKDNRGQVLYWLTDGEVFAPMNYEGVDSQTLNKGQFQLIGECINGQCAVMGEVIFRIFD